MIAPADQFSGEEPYQCYLMRKQDLQTVVLALAMLSLERPGWVSYLRQIAFAMEGVVLFDGFRTGACLPAGMPRDTSNEFGVVRSGDRISVLHWDKVAADHSFTLAGALLCGTWMVKLADPELKEFRRIEAEITK